MRSPSAGTRTSNFEPCLQVAQQVLAQIELHPHVVRIDQRDQRHAGQHELAVLDRDAKHLAVGRRDDDHLIHQRLERLDIGLGALDLGQRDVQILAGEACHRLIVGEARLVERAFRERQRRAVLVELRLRRVVRHDELPRAIERLLRKRQVRFGPLDLRLARRDRLRPEPRSDARQFGFGHKLAPPRSAAPWRAIPDCRYGSAAPLATRPASARRRSARSAHRRAPPCRMCATAPRPGPPAARAGSGTRATARSSPRTAPRR